MAKKIPIIRTIPQPLTKLEAHILHEIKVLLSCYREKHEDADQVERLIYSTIVNDLEKLLSEIAHF
jgi:hypothetical protein